MGKNRLHLYTGNGKGKTTAAMGLALRMLGHGEKTLITQFMKDGTSGDASAPATPPAGQVTGSTATDKTTIDVEAQQKS